MSRIVLIGENSIEYIRGLLDIWNGGDCAVLIAKSRLIRIYECLDNTIELIPYEREDMSA